MTLRLVSVFTLGAAISAFAQLAPPVVSKNVPRAADGHPDLSGIWTNAGITPFERPSELSGKEFLTPEEAKIYEKTHKLFNADDREKIKGTDADVALAYNAAFWDPGTKLFKTRRTSIVIDPPDGKVPALTPERQKQLAAIAAARKKRCERPGCEVENSGILGPADGPEDRPLMERCLSFNNAAPMISSAYNNNYEIVQTPAFVGIDVEMPHQMRRVPIDNSAHLPSNVREWVGDSRGHWEGDTLVIDTTNFNDNPFRGSDENLHLIERLTRTDPDTLIYRFTLDDSTAFTKQWTGEVVFVKAPGPLYEYACHEGNEGMKGILSSARMDEKKAKEKR
jgi:hypothetical protein